MAIIPRATYRLQLHKDFGFDQAAAIVPYLAELGVSHVYCSPYLRARPGSTHGYDIIDHNGLNPEIGDEAAFERFVSILKAHGMGHIIDMVPNHMGVMGADNAWWLDVLESGPASIYADYFDIEWNNLDPVLNGRVLVPVLGDHYGQVLERGELKVAFDAQRGYFRIEYFEHLFPVDPSEYPRLLAPAIAALHGENLPQPARQELESLSAAFSRLPSRTSEDAHALTARRRDKSALKARLGVLTQTHPAITEQINRGLLQLNGDPADRSSFAALEALLEAQAYRLAHWRVASDEINYRRFFDINHLAALRQENPATFEDTHRFMFNLLVSGKADGLRLDHPDGLYDPAEYFAQLQRRYATLTHTDPDAAVKDRPLYVLVEKITAPHEDLPGEWAVHGTTGYRYANVVNGVFVDTSAKNALTRIWQAFAGDEAQPFEEEVYQSRRLIMRSALSAELTVLSNRLLRIARADRRTRDYTLNTLRQALMEIVARFPVYRTYINAQGPSPIDQRYIDWAVARAKRAGAVEESIFDFVRAVLTVQPPPDAPRGCAESYRACAIRFQQFTAPVAAKGVEDTAFYRYNRLLSLNEVGGDPSQFGMTLKAFHGASAARAVQWPHTMLATSTHDNKRSEDVRARLNVLSEMPAAWRLALRRWTTINRSKHREIEGRPAPSRNDEYMLYQTLLGSFPVDDPDGEALSVYCERIQNYMRKAMREAKLHTSWVTVNTAYEEAVMSFIQSLLRKADDNLFLQDFRQMAQVLGWYGALNSLSMALVKLTSPGVPDIYQGNEIFDFSLVDPDNRRPVDYELRRKTLARTQGSDLEECLKDLQGGCAKLAVTARTLNFRREHEMLFREGAYTPLKAHGLREENVLAYRRSHGQNGIIVAVGRLYASLVPAGTLPLGASAWGDTWLELKNLPDDLQLNNVLTEDKLQLRNGRIMAAELFARAPVALLAY